MLKAPFPWFGGKSRVSHIIWDYFSDVDHYIEPFAGSLAVLLGRPNPFKGLETINDKDMYIANFWRALKSDPVQVAYYANNPVNEADLTARHIWLVNEGSDRLQRLQGDPEYYDPKVAGWWVWGICSWIGSNFCSGNGCWTSIDGKLTRIEDNTGVSKRIPHLLREAGINKKSVHLGNPGRGINRKRVHLGGRWGVNRQLLHLTNNGMGINRLELREDPLDQGPDLGETNIRIYLEELAERLRYVRVCCGDWSRVVTKGAMSHGNVIGVFLDPPYDMSVRYECYNEDTEGLSESVREWAIQHGEDPRMRIILCGYEGEHEMPDTWTEIPWVANRSYGRSEGESRNQENRMKERLWISPHCRKLTSGACKTLDSFFSGIEDEVI